MTLSHEVCPADPVRVLLVDDDSEVRALALATLRQTFPDLEATEASDPQSLAAAFDAGGYDVVITDYQLPWTDGIEVLRAVKARWPDCPVLMFTASGSQDVAVEAMKAGLDDYVLKSPKHLARLAPAVRGALERAAERVARRRAEEALRESQAEFDRLLRSIPDYVWSAKIDADGRFSYRYYSPVVEAITGRPADFFRDGPDRWLSTVHPEDRARVERVAKRIVSGASDREQDEYRVVRPDGTVRWVRDSVLARPVAGGGCVLDGVVSDVTERKRAEEALRRSEREHRELFENAVIGVCRTTPEGRILAANPALARLFGYDSLEELMASATDIARQLYADASRRSEFVRRLEEEGSIADFQAEARRKDGARIWVRIHARVVRDEAGLVRYYEGFVEDVTARRRAEEALRESEQRFRTLVESMDDVVFVLDREGRYFGVHGRWLEAEGLAPDHFLGKTAGEVLGPEAGRVHEKASRRALAGESVVYEWSVPGSAAARYFHTRLSPLRGADGSVTAIVGVGREITALKRAEEERARLLERLLAAQDEERRRISRELHDETSQMLTSLLLGLEAITGERSLTGAKTGARRLQEVAQQTIDGLRRLAQGLHPAVLDDLGLVPALRRHAEDTLRPHRTTLRMETEALGERLPTAVETALYRIAQEALTNAARHAAARTVRVTLKREASWVDLEVEDDGCGFDAETTLRAAAAGGRLGLFGIQERAALLGGCFSLESKPGRGTLLRVSLPVRRD